MTRTNLTLFPQSIWRYRRHSNEFEWVTDCSTSCVKSYHPTESRECAPPRCQQGKRYCGRELVEMDSDFANRPNDGLYLCGSNGFLSLLTVCSRCQPDATASYCECTANQQYCSQDFVANHFLQTGITLSSSIVQCEGGTHFTEVQACQHGCSTGEARPYCEDSTCTPMKTYCEEELSALNLGASRAGRLSMYRCSSSGISLESVTCRSACIAGNSSYCIREGCLPGTLYCGYQLQQLYWPASEYDSLTLYKCDDTKVTATLQRRCAKNCLSLAGSQSHCDSEYRIQDRPRTPTRTPCITFKRELTRSPGETYYCASELKDYRACANLTSFPQSIWRLNNINTDFSWVSDCSTACERSDDPTKSRKCAPPKCRSGRRYCGAQLVKMDLSFDHLEPEGLYMCDAAGHVSRTSICSRCTPHNTMSYCGCQPERRYCGSQLLQMNISVDRLDPNGLYLCDTNRVISELTSCFRCAPHPTKSYCECTERKRYCSHESLAKTFPQIDNESFGSIVRCENGSHFTTEKVCSGGCSTREGEPHCEPPKCQPWMWYCGDELLTLRWETSHVDRENLYRCSTTGENVHLFPCLNGCSVGNPSKCNPEKCFPSALYCGQELRQLKWSPNIADESTLYKCDSSGTSATLIRKCIKACERTSTTSSCAPLNCIPGKQYCGGELEQLQWQISAENMNSLHNCSKTGASADVVAVCGGSCVVSPPRESYCSASTCVAGSYYCGHELHEKSWPVWMYEPETVYRCDNSGISAVLQKQCSKSCFGASRSFCDTDCIADKLYCGHELDQIGWANYPQGSLFKCNDTTAVILIDDCGGRCVIYSNGSQCDPLA